MNIALFEKHRPRTLEDVVGQDKAVTTIRAILGNGGFGGQAVWLSGPSGTGKTTLARIIASTIADAMGTTEYKTADELDVATLNDIRELASLHSFGIGGRAIIINEAHALNGRAIRTLLGLLEEIPQHTVYIFTTTKEGQEGLFADQIDAGPLLSRCIPIKTTNQGFARSFAERLQQIAASEGLGNKPVEAYVKIMQDTKNNGRAAIQQLATGALLASK